MNKPDLITKVATVVIAACILAVVIALTARLVEWIVAGL